MDVISMTPRKRTYALKSLGVSVDSVIEQYGITDAWEVCFSDGDILQVCNSNYTSAFDSKYDCKKEAREIAIFKKLESTLNDM